MPPKSGSPNNIELARKEIRANIRDQLNARRLVKRFPTGLIEAMDSLLKGGSHPINKLFELGGMDTNNHDHWRALLFTVVDEVFLTTPPGGRLKDHSIVQHWSLLFYLNFLHELRTEDGEQSGVIEVIYDLPTLSKVGELKGDALERYSHMKPKTLQRYAHRAMTEGAELLKTDPDQLDSLETEVIEKALDNFRPGWKQAPASKKK